MAETQMMVGFGEVDITPSGSVDLRGYAYKRQSTGVHDPLIARSMAVQHGDTQAVLCVADLVAVNADIVAKTQSLLKQSCQLPAENLLISVVHTHTGPNPNAKNEYSESLPALIAQSAQQALENLQPMDLRAAHGQETGLQFIRRYRMADGSVRTNPGIMNPEVVAPIGTVDPELLVLLASAGNNPRGAIVNYGLHCDTVGGTEISADWTYYVRQQLQEATPSLSSVLTPIACCGDVNHWNVFEPVGLRGFEEAERIGRRIASAATKALEHAEIARPGPVHALRKHLELPTRMPTPAQLEASKQVLATPIPEGVDFSMEHVNAHRNVRVAELGPSVGLEVSVIAFGDVAWVGIPAEYFTALGRRIKKESPFPHTFIMTLAGKIVGYIGERQNYDEGGYETTGSVVAPGSGEMIADAALEMLVDARRSM